MLNEKEARDELEKILNGKEYRVYYDNSQNLLQIWWEEAKRWIADQLSKLFPSIEPSGSASNFILIIIIVIIISMIGMTGYFLIRNNIRNRMLSNKYPLQSIKKLNWTYQEHLTEAANQESIGNYTRSTRHLFLALLLYFHEKGWLEARIWKTNWEYYDELKKVNSNWAEQFFHLAYLFDEATYGERNIQKEEFTKFKKEAFVWLKDADESLG